MKLLLDTHLLLWAAGQPQRLPADARVLLAQAQVEGITLLTADPTLAQYSGPVRLV